MNTVTKIVITKLVNSTTVIVISNIKCPILLTVDGCSPLNVMTGLHPMMELGVKTNGLTPWDIPVVKFGIVMMNGLMILMMPTGAVMILLMTTGITHLLTPTLLGILMKTLGLIATRVVGNHMKRAVTLGTHTSHLSTHH